MISLAELERKLAGLQAKGSVDPQGTQINVYPDDVVVEVLVSERGNAVEIDRSLRASLGDQMEGRPVTLITRRTWKVDTVGEPVPAYGPDGGLRAATLVPVRLRSGDEHVLVTVSITTLAGMELERLIGKQPHLLKRVAELLVRGRLQRSGPGYWNPEKESYLELAANGVANVSRLLKQVA